MNKLLFLLLILFACTKEKQPESKCWECIEKSNSTTVKTWTECDVLKVTKDNGKRWITYTWVGTVSTATVHTINCK